MNILITGSNGQLGNEMRLLSAEHPAHTYFFTDVQELDITDASACRHFVSVNHIDLIVNCAAYTNVDRAEEDEPTALLINADAVRNLIQTGARLIHVSTDYVFDGRGFVPYKESDPVAPQTAYGRTKLEGEKLISQLSPDRAVIIRTAWLYSEFGTNFVKTMLRLGAERDELRVVFDQVGSPTYALDLAQAIFAVIEQPQWYPGLYHFTNQGVCSWYDFTVEILRQSALPCRVSPILSSEYQYKTPRPHYSVLDKSKIASVFSLQIPHWQEALSRCLANMK